MILNAVFDRNSISSIPISLTDQNGLYYIYVYFVIAVSIKELLCVTGVESKIPCSFKFLSHNSGKQALKKLRDSILELIIYFAFYSYCHIIKKIRFTAIIMNPFLKVYINLYEFVYKYINKKVKNISEN